jgi:phthiocerol/phenolphthiocerol synthesis type-I polyketide synthase E
MAVLQDDSVRPSLAEVRGFYDAVNQQLSGSAVGDYALFLNYGYVPNENPEQARVTLPRHVLNRNCIRLVLELVGDCPLSPACSVLDVGCGRGGTVGALRRYFAVGPVTAVDLSLAAVAFASRVQGRAVRFLNGNAQELPFRGASFDVVLNLESSHCYPDPLRFYGEVHRLLRPGGYFLYADLLAASWLARGRSALEELGFTVERELDITSNVLLSCDETARVHARAFGDRGALRDAAGFVAAPGSPTYEAMKDGELKYVSYRFRKPGGPA